MKRWVASTETCSTETDGIHMILSVNLILFLNVALHIEKAVQMSYRTP